MWGDIAIAFAIAFLTTFMATPYTINLQKKLEQLIHLKMIDVLIKLQ